AVIVVDCPAPSVYEAGSSIENCGQLSETVPLSVPPPTFWILNVRVALWPIVTVPNDSVPVETWHRGSGGGFTVTPWPLTDSSLAAGMDTVHGRSPGEPGEKRSVKLLDAPGAIERLRLSSTA